MIQNWPHGTLMINVDLIERRKYTRPGQVLIPWAIAVHWTATPRATARNTHDYFNTSKRYASAHYAVDWTEIIQMIPIDEVAYHVGAHRYTNIGNKRFQANPNKFLIGIELCHKDWNGKFEPTTIHLAIELCALLCWRLDFDPISDIYRHTDITGKGTQLNPAKYPCPRYFVENPEAWDIFKLKVKERLV